MVEYRRSGLSAAQLSAMQDKLPQRAFLFAALALIAWTYTICFLYNEVTVRVLAVNIAQNVYVVLFPCAITVLAIRDSLRAYQVCELALVTFSEWIVRISARRPGDSGKSPPKSGSNGPSLTSLIIFGLTTAGLAFLWPHILFAQTVAAGAAGPIDMGQSSTQLSGAYGTLAKLGSTDLSGQWLARLFPSLSGASSNSDQLSSLLSSFNTILLDAGSGIAFWQGSLGIIYAAQNGSLEGSNIHGVISPLRALAGAGALFPVMGGYCLMQLFALQILGGGYWMADQLNTALVTPQFNSSAATPASAAIPVDGMQELISTALSAETCYAWYSVNNTDASQLDLVQTNPYYLPSSAGNGDLATGSNSPWDLTPTTTTDAYTYNLGECGVLALGSAGNGNTNAKTAFGGGSAFDSSRNAQFQTYMNAVWSSGLPQALASIFTANGGATIGQSATAAPTASTLSTDYASVVNASTTYFQSLQGDGQTLTSSGLTSYASAINSSETSLGWVSAGALFSAVSQMYTRTTSAIDGSIPSLTVTSLEGVSSSDQASIQAAYNEVSSFMSSAVLPTQPTFSATNGNENPTAPTAGTSFSSETDTQRVLNEPAAGLLYYLDNTLLLDPANPMASVVSEGHKFMWTGEAIVGAIAVVKVASSLPGVKQAVGVAEGAAGANPLTSLISSGLGKAVSIGLILGEILIFVGAFECYVIPMLFYIAWMFQIVNCIAFAAEFVLAAPLAAYQFMRINGTEAVGPEQRQFFLIAFMQGFLRPSLLIFGLVISSYVFSSIATVLNATFNLAVAASQGDSIVGPIGIITYVLMLVFIQWQLCVRSISLIGRVPDAVADLVGGAAGRMSGIDEQALGVTGAVTPHVRGVTGSLIGFAIGKAGKTAEGGSSGSPQVNKQ
jgi:conjugal transfer/type IV secretion protein DotA/TraY